MNKRWLFILGLVGFAVWFMRRKAGTDNDLKANLREQEALQDQGKIANQIASFARDQFPLTTIGDTPLAGVWFDPFNVESPASRPKTINFGQTIPADLPSMRTVSD